MRFRDRTDAGRRLAGRIRLALGDTAGAVVLALPRGGVPVAVPVAEALDAPLDVYVVRKLGAPGHREFGVGALAEDGPPLVDARSAERAGASASAMEQIVMAERAELARRVQTYRGGRPLPDVTGRDVVVVDDGLATGVSMHAAVRGLATRNPQRILAAAPVGAPSSVERLRAEGAQVVCIATPRHFDAVGAWYDDFSQLTDDDVLSALSAAARSRSDQ